jgi:ectoine hydroxylase-related dioxygenase (phytanoyl-CoA dioxygenase family)
MWTKLNYYDLAITLPIEEGSAPVQSQRWHRDNEEKRMCKMFIYLSDVDETAGPFTYIPGTVRGQRLGHLFPQRPPEGNYPPEGALGKVVPENERRIMTGRAGTVIFCDTTGLHRGGYATKRERLMYTVFFTAPSWTDKRYYTMPGGKAPAALSIEATYAVS